LCSPAGRGKRDPRFRCRNPEAFSFYLPTGFPEFQNSSHTKPRLSKTPSSCSRSTKQALSIDTRSFRFQKRSPSSCEKRSINIVSRRFYGRLAWNCSIRKKRSAVIRRPPDQALHSAARQCSLPLRSSRPMILRAAPYREKWAFNPFLFIRKCWRRKYSSPLGSLRCNKTNLRGLRRERHIRLRILSQRSS